MVLTMTEGAHTPGPWVWNGKYGSLHQAGDPPYKFGKSVLVPIYEYDSGTDTKVSDADAKLIAAAPEMLAELKRLFDLFGHQATADIIRKAELP